MRLIGQFVASAVLGFAAVAGFAAAAQDRLAETKDKSIVYRSGDPEIAAAVEKARQTLQDFWNMMAAPQGDVGQFSLKVAIRDPGADITEHFWLGSLKTLEDGRIEGTINNVPNHAKTVKHGQRYTFETEQITDWMYYRRGKIVGGYTIRPMLRQLPKERADQIRRMLENP